MKTAQSLNVLILLVFCTGGVRAELPVQRDTRLAWWSDARFGMFIHWGPVSLTGQEISWSRANSNTNCPNNGPIPVAKYDNLYKQFNPTNFNADEWVHIAKSGGMKYLVFTAKHGDGFLLWDSQVDGYNIGAPPFHRNVCAELAAAAHRQHERIGWYFSPMDWRDPDCRSANNDRFVKKNQAELRELLSHYGKIDVLWFDLDGMPTMWDPPATYALVRGLQPQIIINNRLEMSSFEEWSRQGGLKSNEDFYTPEQRIGAYDEKMPWETCMTIGTQWSWKPDDKIKSASDVLHILAQCAGGDGNLLLDVGPMPDGRIEPRQVEVLSRVGAWLDKNGESIYGTRGGPWKPTRSIASTRKGDVIYVHILQSENGVIELPAMDHKIESARILGGGRIEFRQRDGQFVLVVPAGLRDPSDTVVKLKLAGSAMAIPAMDIPPGFKAAASNVFEKDESGYGPQNAFDDDDQTRWATDHGVKQAWIAVDFLKPRTVSHIHVVEACPNRVQKFELQYLAADHWKPLLAGMTLGADFNADFAPATARDFRLNILEATEGPTISEIKLSN